MSCMKLILFIYDLFYNLMMKFITSQQHLKEAITFWSITNHDGINWILNQWDKLRHDVSLFAVSVCLLYELALYVMYNKSHQFHPILQLLFLWNLITT